MLFIIFILEPIKYMEDEQESNNNRICPTTNDDFVYSTAPEYNNDGADNMTNTSLSISHSDNGRQFAEPAPFVPRIDLPQRRVDDNNRRARRDYFSIPRSSNAYDGVNGNSYLCKSSEKEPFDFQQKPAQRSKSVSRPIDNIGRSFQDRIVSAGVREAQSNGTNDRMYSRSCSRYRSTDMDVALANTTVSRENLSTAPLNGDITKKKMALSLFDLSNKMASNFHGVNGKSTNSLLETDIDTGEQKSQQIVLETDVDTLNTCRLVGGLIAGDQGPIQSANDKTYSLFNLTTQPKIYQRVENKHQSRADAYKRAQSLSGIAKTGENCKSEPKTVTSGLVARLRARARSNHELRVAESLTRIHVPDWLDKADLSKPISPVHRSPSPSPPREPNTSAVLGNGTSSLPYTTLLQSPLLRYTSKTVETISKPTYSFLSPSRPELRRPLRPSQILRERNASSGPRLAPIKSSLRSSMKSQVKSEGVESSTPPIRPDPAASSSHAVHLSPEDFLTRNEKVWNEPPPSPQIPLPVPTSYTNTAAASAEIIQAPKQRLILTPSSPSSLFSQTNSAQNGRSTPIKREEERLSSPNNQDYSDSIRMVDSDSLVNNQFYQPMEMALNNNKQTPTNNRINDEEIYEEVQRPIKFAPPPLSIPHSSPSNSSFSNHIGLSSNPQSPTWHNADSDGESETVATDGLDNISDLTCLTDLLDRCSSRHLNLLQNRPSALEGILSQFGWWSSSSSNGNHLQRGSGDYVALAAGAFNPDEDSHRNEFLTLLCSPASQGPLILTEFGFDQKRIGIDRNPKDGMLYLRCNNPSCPRMGPTRVDKARSWRTCTNCFTTYCSSKCREQAQAVHNMVCTFGRVRLVCGRILHSLAPSQQASLTALAKAGATRLGRGGILITFASVQDAEYFLTRSAENFRNQHPGIFSTNRSSPSGLIAPPIYLTIDELNKLDSKLATPCRIYKPSVSYVLIVIVCAYDLEIMKTGRAVHLYKQCIVLPFPTATPQVFHSVEVPQTRLILGGKEIKVPRTTKEEREAYLKQLQRTLRERGISLRHTEPEIYKRLSTFVETGDYFEPIEFDFHDYYSNQVITCTVAPMKDVVIHKKADFSRKILSEETHQSGTYSKAKVHRMPRSRIGETEL